MPEQPPKSAGTAFDPDWVISPGETLREWIEENNLTVRVTATACNLPVEAVQGVVDAKTRLSPRIAVGLEQGTQIPAYLWLNLERAYRNGLRAGKKDVSR